MEIRGKTVVLTGASGGIGSALALELCAEAAEVIAIGRRPAALETLRQRAAGRPGRLRPLVADINCPLDRARISEVVTAPDALIHAAAIGSFGLFEHSDAAGREALFQTNVLAPMALTQALLPALLRPTEAAVLAVGSTFGSLAHPGFAAYSASKFALRGFIEALGREYADTGLRTQWIAPRATDTAFNPPNVVALNKALGTRVDAVEDVAVQIVLALRAGTRRRQLGWPERLFTWLNAAFPALVDRGLQGALPIVRAHAALVREVAPLPSRCNEAAVPQAPVAPAKDRRTGPLLDSAHIETPGACEALGVEAKTRLREDSVSMTRRPIAISIGQEPTEELTTQSDLQPRHPKSDRLLAADRAAGPMKQRAPSLHSNFDLAPAAADAAPHTDTSPLSHPHQGVTP